MAIIKTLLLQDLIRLAGRRLLLWTVLLVCGYIQCAQAALVGEVKLKGPTGTETENTETYRFDYDAPAQVLTCSLEGPSASGADKFRIYQIRLPPTIWTSWGATNSITMSRVNKAAIGRFKCDIQDSGSVEKSSPEITVTWKCTPSSTTDPCAVTWSIANSKCAGESGEEFCQCKHAPGAGAFPKCFVCSNTTHAGCSGGKPRCDSNSCEPCEPSGNVGCTEPNKPYCPVAGACKACVQNTNAGCTDDHKPYCEKAGEPCKPCNVTDNKPCEIDQTCASDGVCEFILKGADPTDESSSVATESGPTNTAGSGTNSKGTTSQASVTSNAGTVTSTVRVVITSVIVALMN